MAPEPPTQPEEAALVIRSQAALTTLPVGGMPVLSEIINRSLVHIQTSRALATPERRAGEECDFEIAPGVSIVMCWIPSGEFLMGSLEDEKGRLYGEKQHWVRITKGFWLAKTPITQAQWEAVMGGNPCAIKANDLPVNSVSWLDVCGDETRTGGFLGAINRMSSKGSRFDLPTEAQWEYACRAGTTGTITRQLDSDEVDMKNCFHLGTYPVGRKKPNAWGLHDMLGNVWEWCSDWHGAYSGVAETDPAGPQLGLDRVFRGGGVRVGGQVRGFGGTSYEVNGGGLRSMFIFEGEPPYDAYSRAAHRDCYSPARSAVDLGFRIARISVP